MPKLTPIQKKRVAIIQEVLKDHILNDWPALYEAVDRALFPESYGDSVGRSSIPPAE